MKRPANILHLLLATVLFVLTAACTKTSTYSEQDRPDNVPESAIWSGGPDGGEWIEFVERHGGMYRYRIYRDCDGSLLLDADFRLTGSTRPEYSGWEKSVCCFEELDGGVFNLSFARKTEGQDSCYVLQATDLPYGGYYRQIGQLCIKHPVTFWDWHDQQPVVIYNDSIHDSVTTVCRNDSSVNEVVMFVITDKSSERFQVIAFSGNSDSIFAKGWIEKSRHITVYPKTEDEIVFYKQADFDSETVAKYRIEELPEVMSVLDFDVAEWLYVEYTHADTIRNGWIPPCWYSSNPY